MIMSYTAAGRAGFQPWRAARRRRRGLGATQSVSAGRSAESVTDSVSVMAVSVPTGCVMLWQCV